MFEIGRYYDFYFADCYDDHGNIGHTLWGHRKVLAVEGSVVKFEDVVSGEVIVNTASPMFFKAERSRHDK